MTKPLNASFMCLALIWLSINSAGAFAADPTAEELAFFEKKIRPVLVEHCYQCHSAGSNDVQGELLLDTREGIRKGGVSGHAVVPENLKESLLIEAIRYGDDALAMPPKKKLPDSVIADFEKWITMGAPDPREGKGAPFFKPDWTKSRNHWAFKVPTQPEIPSVSNDSWAASAIDRFVLAALDKEGMKPVGDANRRTLIRRLYFDLTGLPPTPEEVDAFLSETDPDAWQRLVDQLLATERFGERWGRHWLDVARYAESSGKESNITYPHAWRYRDYVIDSFNADKPYDQFIREQIAGDMMPAEDDRHRAELITATGFLAIGPKSHNEGSRSQFAADLVDEQIETMSRSMLGLTIACARCHDHKFDPITQTEYYAMAGIFHSSSTWYGTVETQGNRRNSRLRTLPVETAETPARPLTAESREALKKVVAASREEQARLIVQAREDRKNDTYDSFTYFIRTRRVKDRMNVAAAQLNNYTEDGTAKPQAMGMRERGYGRGTRLLVLGQARRARQTVPRGFVSIVNPDFTFQFSRRSSGRLQLADWIVDDRNPLTARVMVNRIWHHLFGQGLLRNMDNFGSTGGDPSHPELLDHLAMEFKENGWSVKHIIREIVLSHTYRLASDYDSANYSADPDNRYLWRRSKRRLEAESIRDTMLSVGGLLNQERPRGSAVSDAGDGRVGRGRTNSRALSASTDHRSVYLPIVRGLVSESLRLFDYAEPSMVTGKRDITTVPAQALYLMNDSFVLRVADALALRVIADEQTLDERIQRAYQLAYGRLPRADELVKSQRFFDQFQKSSPEVKQVSKGVPEFIEPIKELQRALNAQMKSTRKLQVDGNFGFNTRLALVQFQQLNELPANGQLDAATRKALGVSDLKETFRKVAQRKAMSAFCQALVCSAEFRYVD